MTQFGVYVHVPFCSSRCDYCAFATWTDRDHLMVDYVEACVSEVRKATEEESLPRATSIFVGGGTPSRLEPDLLGSVISAIARTDDAEVTVECNPEDGSPDRFSRWRKAGVNRVSFGVQSMVPKVLAGLGRHHDPDAVERAISSAAEAGIESVNVDLIYGGAGETDHDWVSTLEGVLSLDPRPKHISAYALTVEPGTPLASDRSRHPDDDTQARRYEMAEEILSAAGYNWYEVSNWSIPGNECLHNRLYWSQGDYRGIGCAAHSHTSGRRWWNIRTPERYIETVRSGRSQIASEEILTADQRAFEALVLSVRTAYGVPSDAVDESTDLDGLMEPRGDRMVLTLRGRLLANEVASRLTVPPTVPLSR